MGDSRSQSADELHFLRLDQLELHRTEFFERVQKLFPVLAEIRVGFLEGFVGIVQLGNVPRDTESPHQAALGVAQGGFGGEHPDRCPVGPAGLQFDLVHDGRHGLHDAALILEANFGLFRGMKVEVGLAKGLCGIVKPEIVGQRAADAEESALGVFEIDVIRARFEHRMQENLLGIRVRCTAAEGGRAAGRIGGHRKTLREEPGARIQIF